MTLGLVTLFSTYTAMLTWPVRQLGRILADMGKASISLQRLTEIMDAEPEKEPGKALTVDMTGDVAAMEGMVCGGTMDVLIEDLPVEEE